MHFRAEGHPYCSAKQNTLGTAKRELRNPTLLSLLRARSCWTGLRRIWIFISVWPPLFALAFSLPLPPSLFLIWSLVLYFFSFSWISPSQHWDLRQVLQKIQLKYMFLRKIEKLLAAYSTFRLAGTSNPRFLKKMVVFCTNKGRINIRTPLCLCAFPTILNTGNEDRAFSNLIKKIEKIQKDVKPILSSFVGLLYPLGLPLFLHFLQTYVCTYIEYAYVCMLRYETVGGLIKTRIHQSPPPPPPPYRAFLLLQYFMTSTAASRRPSQGCQIPAFLLGYPGWFMTKKSSRTGLSDRSGSFALLIVRW